MQIQYVQPFVLTVIAGLSTAVGSLIFLVLKKFDASRLVFLMGLSAGAMIYVSFVELLNRSVNSIGFVQANLWFALGIVLMALIDYMIPHRYMNETEGVDPADKKLYKTGVLIALGIAIHNLPEGLAVFISAATDMKMGIALATAIAVHNIPEGIAVAVPIYYATKSQAKAFWYSFLSGVAEPIGALIGIYCLQSFLSEDLVSKLLALVAGIMVFISFDELIPQAFGNENHNRAIQGILVGFLLVMISLAI